jgi:hypothetical protein
MFELRNVILRLRDKCPIFAEPSAQGQPKKPGYVGGTTELGQAYDLLSASADLGHMPCAFVVPLYELDISSELPSYSPEREERLEHKIRQHFAVIVCVGNSVGSPGKENKMPTSVEVLAVAQKQLMEALLGWKVRASFGPVRFARSDHLAMNNKYLWHAFEWTLTYIINPAISDELLEQSEAIVNGWDMRVPTEDSTLAKVRDINVRQSSPPKRSVADYYDPAPLAGPADAQLLQAAEDGKDFEFDAEQPPLPTEEQLAGAAYHEQKPPPIFWHGLHPEEVTGDE